MSTRSELQYQVIKAAVDAVCQHVSRAERAGAQLMISTEEAAARVVHHALCEWVNDVGADEPAAEWERSANDVLELLDQAEWMSVALASRSEDGRVPIDWTVFDRQAPQAATAG